MVRARSAAEIPVVTPSRASTLTHRVSVPFARVDRIGVRASSAALASQLIGREPSPSEAAREVEQRRWLQDAIDRMNPLDREVLALRYFEHLTSAETALVLGLTPAAASKRHVRALERLNEILAAMPRGLGEE